MNREIKIYPNPVEGNYLNIQSPQRDLKYEVFNTLGQLVDKGEITNNKIDISNLESAVYQITFFTEGEIISKRFIRK